MSDTAIQPTAPTDPWAIMERVIAAGDLAKLTAQERVLYYRQVCESVGLNPLTRPFEYITLNGKLTLYARKDATDQLRKLGGVSIFRMEEATLEGVHTCRAYARVPDGREDTALGAVSVEGLRGEALANALMKAETKAKRRVTLSICGLGFLDETEVETVPSARPVVVNTASGEILDAAAPSGQDQAFEDLESEPVVSEQLAAIRAELARQGKDEAAFVRVNLRGVALADLTYIQADKTLRWLQEAARRRKGGQAA